MKKYLGQLLVLVISGILSPPVQAQEAAEEAEERLELRGSDCILIRTIRDYTPLDDRSLLVRGSARRSYLVTLTRPAFGMRSSFRLGFSSRDGQLCPYGGDAIVFDGLGGDSVRVRAISRVSKEQAEELLIRHGKKKPAEQQAPSPGDVPGAKVEELG